MTKRRRKQYMPVRVDALTAFQFRQEKDIEQKRGRQYLSIIYVLSIFIV